jgi:hypothetical protein
VLAPYSWPVIVIWWRRPPQRLALYFTQPLDDAVADDWFPQAGDG